MLRVMSIQTRFLSPCCQLRIERLLMASEIHLMIRCSASIRIPTARQLGQHSLLLQAAWTRSQSKIFCCSFIWNHKTWVRTRKVSQKESQSLGTGLCSELTDLQDNAGAFKSAIHHHFLTISFFSKFSMRWWPMGRLVGRSNSTSYYYKWILNCLNEPLETWASPFIHSKFSWMSPNVALTCLGVHKHYQGLLVSAMLDHVSILTFSNLTLQNWFSCQNFVGLKISCPWTPFEVSYVINHNS